ncbi:MAG: hypothetical protein AB7I42_24060 [Bradyrhizobium sp.]|uniref:hypothetical protein n=1 Tax=Bradyrhizobium sp. TaxID=376 RepID=UPI003D1061ED
MKISPIIPCPFRPLRGFYCCLLEMEKTGIAIPDQAQSVAMHMVIAAVGLGMFDEKGQEIAPQCKLGQYVYLNRAPNIIKTKDGRQWCFPHESEIRATEDE